MMLSEADRVDHLIDSIYATRVAYHAVGNDFDAYVRRLRSCVNG
jgi:hypothetical protein